MKFLRNEHIEQQAEARLTELAQLLREPLTPPIPIDLLAEQVLGLDFLWDYIEELPGETILGGLSVERRLIVLNERHRDLFARKPGLERSTKGHEMGHWDLFVDLDMLDQPSFLDVPGGPFVHRGSGAGPVSVLAELAKDPAMWDIACQLLARSDRPDEARSVNRYAAAISLPRALLYAESRRTDFLSWPVLYTMTERFDVTITALTVRLGQLGLAYVKDKRLYRSRAEADGQQALW